MNRRAILLALLLSLAIHPRGTALADDKAAATGQAPIRVTVDNFVRAETDNYFTKFEKDGAFGKFHHERTLAPIDNQTVIRMNRDTLYSMGVFDLDAGPVVVTLPDPGKRFLAMQVVNEDHYTPMVLYTPGAHTFTREKIGTRYVAMLVRIFADPLDSADLKTVNTLQDAIRVEQKDAGQLVVPPWDPASLKTIRDALLALTAANGGLSSAKMFGPKDKVDPVQHLLGTAAGWGGNPAADAMYLGVVPKQNDGKTAYRLTVKEVPVDGFWSISVYNKDGFFEKNALNAYTLNNVTAKRNPDGTVTIHFGDCGDGTPNCLPITPGWNYLVRLYRPRAEILDGNWSFPQAELVK